MRDARFVVVDGVNTRYYEAGPADAEAVVLIHGGGFGQYSNAYDWSCTFDALLSDFHVYAPDKLGMGHTDNPADDAGYTMGSTIAHVVRFLEVVGIQQAVLVGHSRGGLPAARIAVDRPDLVKGLVIVDSQTLAPEHPSTPRDFYTRLAADAPAVPDAEYVQREIVANSYSTEHVTSDLIEERLGVALLPKVQVAKSKMVDLLATQFLPDARAWKYETLERIRETGLTIPVLVAWGLNDPSAPVVLAYRLFEHLSFGAPRSELHLFNRSGHYPHRERAREFERVLNGFLHELALQP